VCSEIKIRAEVRLWRSNRPSPKEMLGGGRRDRTDGLALLRDGQDCPTPERRCSEHSRGRPEEGTWVFGGEEGADQHAEGHLVFWGEAPSGDGAYYAPNILNRALFLFREAASKAGFPDKYTFHCLRRSRITRYAIHQVEEEGQTDILRIAQFAGHSKTENTLLYVHLAEAYMLARRPQE